MSEDEPALLAIDDLHVVFRQRGGPFGARRRVHAVAGIDLVLERGRTLGLVGESGCGKSTLLRTIAGLQKPTAGRVMLGGVDATAARGKARRQLRRMVQVVFQDPAGSLNPRMTIHDIVAEPLRVQRCYSAERVATLLNHVGMTAEVGDRKPGQFSGGQRQRIGIARALALDPALLLLDEPVSALDVSIRAQVINLLVRLQTELGLTYLMVTHDLSVVRYLAHSIAVMFRGRIVEIGANHQVLTRPAHPYTRALLAASNAGRTSIDEPVPSGDAPPAESPTGCAFRSRCPSRQSRCSQEAPLLRTIEAQHDVACWYPDT
jgi:oligopeptide/dipeptide ABC transporter ATP-binding protein